MFCIFCGQAKTLWIQTWASEPAFCQLSGCVAQHLPVAGPEGAPRRMSQYDPILSFLHVLPKSAHRRYRPHPNGVGAPNGKFWICHCLGYFYSGMSSISSGGSRISHGGASTCWGRQTTTWVLFGDNVCENARLMKVRNTQ